MMRDERGEWIPQFVFSISAENIRICWKSFWKKYIDSIFLF